MRSRPRSEDKLTAISLFTGAGGLDYGFEAAGFRTAVAVEIDDACVATLRRNRKWPLIRSDIAEVTGENVLAAGGLCCGQADILIGGPPCQPFSKSGFWANGEALRLNDPRADTLTAYLRLLAETRPKAFLLENVEGFGFHGKDEGLRLVTSSLATINAQHGTFYRASVAVLNSADFGVPQIRRRMFIIGARDGTTFRFPTPTHTDLRRRDSNNERTPYLTAWDALHDLRDPDDISLAVRGKWADLLPSIPEGHNYLWHTDRGGGEPLFGWRRRYWSFLLKLAKDKPSWTLQAQPGPATGPFHWKNRKLSVPEMARLQTFPNNVEIVGSYYEAQRQIGNAVPSLLGEMLAREVAQQLLGCPKRWAELVLSVKQAKVPPPPAEATAGVPPHYLALRGPHLPHPGTGGGHRAVARGGTALVA